MSKGAKILVIDDEASMRKLLNISLSQEGYFVELAKNGKEGIAELNNFRPDIILLDLSLPDIEGLDVLRNIRERTATPVIVLTVRDSDADKVALFDAGADDYLTKPFSVAELAARIKVALRHGLKSKGEPVFESGPLKINFAERSVLVNGDTVKLTSTEYDLLKILVQNSGKIVTQKQLLTEVWGATSVNQTHYLRIYFGQLRKKLDKYDLSNIIVTEPGVGYRLDIQALEK